MPLIQAHKPSGSVTAALILVNMLLPFLTLFHVILSTMAWDPSVPFELSLGLLYAFVALPILFTWLSGRTGIKSPPPASSTSLETTYRNIRLAIALLIVGNLACAFLLGWITWGIQHASLSLGIDAAGGAIVGSISGYYFSILGIVVLRLSLRDRMVEDYDRLVPPPQ